MASFAQMDWRTRVAVKWDADVDVAAFFKGVEIKPGGVGHIRYNHSFRGSAAAVARANARTWRCLCRHVNPSVATATGEGDIYTVKGVCELCGQARPFFSNCLWLRLRIDRRRYPIRLSKKGATFTIGKRYSSADVVAALWAHARSYALVQTPPGSVGPKDLQKVLRFTTEPLYSLGITPLCKVSLWNDDGAPLISLLHKHSRVDRFVYALAPDCSANAPISCYTVDGATGTARSCPQTRQFTALAKRRRRERLQTTFYVRPPPPHADPGGTTFVHTGTEDDLKRNYERFVEACDVFQGAATQIQSLWRGVQGRRLARQAREVYFAPAGRGCRAAATHFLETARGL